MAVGDLESLQGFESDVMHYVAQLDRAVVQLARLIQLRESGVLYQELKQLRSHVGEMGYKVSEYVGSERQRIFAEIDQESGRKAADERDRQPTASGVSGAGRLSKE